MINIFGGEWYFSFKIGDFFFSIHWGGTFIHAFTYNFVYSKYMHYSIVYICVRCVVYTLLCTVSNSKCISRSSHNCRLHGNNGPSPTPAKLSPPRREHNIYILVQTPRLMCTLITGSLSTSVCMCSIWMSVCVCVCTCACMVYNILCVYYRVATRNELFV